MKIGVMGAVGSFTEQAALSYAAQTKIITPEIVPLVHIEAVLQALDEAVIEIAIFPVQNSISGVVHSSMQGMSGHVFSIKDFYEIEIEQNLLVLPGTTAAELTQIVSQTPALNQCRSYLSRVWAGVPIHNYVDTAQAAADLASGVLPKSTAVIASARCAEVYDLEIMEAAVQDLKHNNTTFLVVSK